MPASLLHGRTWSSFPVYRLSLSSLHHADERGVIVVVSEKEDQLRQSATPSCCQVQGGCASRQSSFGSASRRCDISPPPSPSKAHPPVRAALLLSVQGGRAYLACVIFYVDQWLVIKNLWKSKRVHYDDVACCGARQEVHV
jgi:hypothetical protein